MVLGLFILLITNFCTGLLLMLYAIMDSTKGEKAYGFWKYWLSILIFPSIGYGLWVHRKEYLEKKAKIQGVPYHVFNSMFTVHMFSIAVAMIVACILDYEAFLTFLFGIIYFTFTSVGGVLIIAIILILVYVAGPLLIAKTFFKKDLGPLSSVSEGLLDDGISNVKIKMDDWERAKPPTSGKDLSFDVDDEYISLADDNEDDFEVDI